ncbi:unnamed protein product, partial [Brenthis ino]
MRRRGVKRSHVRPRSPAALFPELFASRDLPEVKKFNGSFHMGAEDLRYFAVTRWQRSECIGGFVCSDDFEDRSGLLRGTCAQSKHISAHYWRDAAGRRRGGGGRHTEGEG